MSSSYYSYGIIHMCEPGYIFGNTKAVIPWAKVIVDPTAWINENCYPLRFQWADPSKSKLAKSSNY